MSAHEASSPLCVVGSDLAARLALRASAVPVTMHVRYGRRAFLGVVSVTSVMAAIWRLGIVSVHGGGPR